MSNTPAPPRPATPQAIQHFLDAAKRRRHHKSVTNRMIDGDTGPPMVGVIHYPYSTSQRLYLSDFRAMAAGTVTHPFVKTTVAGASSIPFDVLSGSAFDDDKVNGAKLWQSESFREFVPRSITASKTILATGVRSECVQFLG